MLNTYEVTLTSDLLDGPLVADVPATTEHAAISRLRMYAFHEFECADMLRAECVAVLVTP